MDGDTGAGPARVLARLIALAALLACSSEASSASRRLLQSGVAPKLARGQPAPCGRYPYMVSIRSRENVHKCGGVLVHPRFVLTAAHCVDPNGPLSAGPSPVVVIGGCHLDDVENENGLVEMTASRETFFAPGWTGNVTEGADIALLSLKDASRHAPALLPAAGEEQARPSLALGWGVQEAGSASDPGRLQEASKLNILGNDFCNGSAKNANNTWEGIIKDSMICAFGTLGEELCSGDSGGPLLDVTAPQGNRSAGRADLDLVVGITSFGEEIECGASKKPTVFTRVSSFRGWIIIIIGTTPAHNASAVVQVPFEPNVTAQETLDQELLQLAGSEEGPSTKDAVSQLLSDGADPDACCFDIDRDTMGPCNALHAASFNGNFAVVSALTAAGANLTAQCGSVGWTAMHMAVEMDRLRLVRFFIESGMGVDTRRENNWTALHIAAFWDHLDVAEYLVGQGAAVDPVESVRMGTPLVWAALKDSRRVARLIIEAGADVNARSDFGRTPLSLATERQYIEMVELLVANGANTTEPDNKGLTPVDYICFKRCTPESKAALEGLLL